MKKTTLLKTAILTMSLVQMGTNGIAPILAQISGAFPQASDTAIQFLMTFPSIFCLLFTIISALLSDKLPKKALAVFGLSLICLTGILACLFHTSLLLLYIWAAFLGIGIGMVAPLAPALVNECFEGSEKQTMLGWQNSANNVGSMLMTFLGGFLALLGWPCGYLVYLLGIPGIVFALLAIPEKNALQKNAAFRNVENREPFRLVVLKEMIITAVFLFVYAAVPANLAMLTEERQLGDTAFAGTVSTIFLLGGTIMGLFFGLLYRKLLRFTSMTGALFLALGSFLVGISKSPVLLFAGCLIAGASISIVLPVNMGAASRLKGYETLNSALLLSSSFVGVFLAPFITDLAFLASGSTSVSFRFHTIAVIALGIAALTLLLKPGQTAKTDR